MGTAGSEIAPTSAWLAPALATVFAAALGAAFGDLLLKSVLQSISAPAAWLQIAVAAPLMYLASRHFLDPLSRGFRILLRLPAAPVAADAPSGRGLWLLAVGSGVMIGWLGNLLGEFAQAHSLAVLMTIGVSVVLVGGITAAWIVGVRTGRRLAGLLGAIIGFVINSAATIAVLWAQGFSINLALLSASLASGLSVGLVGLAGGLTVDLGLSRRPSLAATLAALAMFAVTGSIAAWRTGSGIQDLLPNLMLGFGWLLGLVSSPYADALLSRAKRSGGLKHNAVVTR
jgi:hypothetical protein